MYEITTANLNVERKLKEDIALRKDILEKLERLKENPRKANGVHPLHGKLKGKMSLLDRF